MVLVSPPGGGSIDRTKPIAQTNPLLQFTDDLRTTASILILAMNSPDVFKSLGVTEDGPTELTIDDGRSNPELLGVGTTGPFIYVSVRSPTRATAVKVLAATQKRIRDELDRRQRELMAHPVTYLKVDDVVLLEPEEDLAPKLQGAVGGVVLGLLGGFGVAYAVVRRRLALQGGEPPVAGTTESAVADEAEPEDPWAAEKPAEEPAPVNGKAVKKEEEPAVLSDLDMTGPIDIIVVGDKKS